MNKQTISKKTNNKNRPRIRDNVARFTNIRDPIVVDASQTTLTLDAISTDSSGNFTGTYVLAPMGINGLKLASGAFSEISLHNPKLGWLLYQCRSFNRYRISRATVVLTGSTGSISTGTIGVTSFSDNNDAYSFTITNSNLGPQGRSFDVASLSTGPRRVPLEIDSSWKVVTSDLVNASSYGPGVISILNTLNDLVFTNLVVRVSGGPASTTLCTMALEFDVEFASPTSGVLNS